MSKADEPAFPTHPNKLPGHFSKDGLTKREYFACHAPITRDDAAVFLLKTGKETMSYEDVADAIAEMRVMYADALIAALERRPE